jgi:hypothetical protein
MGLDERFRHADPDVRQRDEAVAHGIGSYRTSYPCFFAIFMSVATCRKKAFFG